MNPLMNRVVLMSGTEYFDVASPINPYMKAGQEISRTKATQEHAGIAAALRSAGVKIVRVPAPKDCQDGVYTANWALVRGETAVLARLPNARKAEETYAEQILRDLGKTVVRPPQELRFSGQGDALPCGNLLFAGSQYRTDLEVHKFIAQTLNYEVISLQTIPLRSLLGFGKPLINKASGWPDSYFYDIDLALAVLRPAGEKNKGLIAWCPEAFVPSSRAQIEALDNIDKISVSLPEARRAFACNLVSTGQSVVMSDHAPILKAALEAQGLKVLTPQISELAKGGGYIRCTTLTLDN
jgi:N-dimethylarginine dimethylaminohydrolase